MNESSNDDGKPWALDWALRMAENDNSRSFRRQAVRNPADAGPLIGAAWPPLNRLELLAGAKRIRRALVLRAAGLISDPSQVQYMIRVSDRVKQLIEFFQRRDARWRTGEVWTVTAPNGRTVRFPMNDPAAHMFKKIVDDYGGLYERDLVNFLLRRLGPGDIFVDVGAHTGYISGMAATTGATVFAMEIQRNLMPLIEQLATLNAFDHLRPLYLGASSRAGLSLMRRGWTTPAAQLEGATTMELLRHPRSIVNDYVPTISLDDAYCDDDLLPTIVKIDAEGHEIDILDGARRLIERRRTIFVVEFHSREHIRSFDRRDDELSPHFDPALWDYGQLTGDGIRPITDTSEVTPDQRDSHPKVVFTPKAA